MATLYIDFETYDPTLKETGSCYIWNPDFSIVGMSYAIDDGEVRWTTNQERMRRLIAQHSSIVAHNISYELGVLKYLGIEFKDKEIYCTVVGSKLLDNRFLSYSLDYLAKRFFKEEKDQKRIGRALLSCGAEFVTQFWSKKYYKEKEKDTEEARQYCLSCNEKAVDSATKWAMQNMKESYELIPDVIEEYAKSDVELTRKLHKMLLTRICPKLYNKWSDLNKITTEMRHAGVRVDVERAKEVYEILTEKINALQAEAELAGWWCNYGSNKQLGELLVKLGIQVTLKESGAVETDKDALDNIDHPIGAHIRKYRKYLKARDDFVDNIIKNNHGGRIHGSMTVLGAIKTGRFSHKLPNLGQIPSRDEEIGPLLRSLFVADEGAEWHHLDFSAQEPRLYVHFAAKCQKAKVAYCKEIKGIDGKWKFDDKKIQFNCPMIWALVDAYKSNPNLDSHEYNRQLIERTTGVKLTRKDTKTFALGKAYEKGIRSLSEDLGIDYEKAKDFYEAFEEAAPYIGMTSAYAKYRFAQQGFITTIGGRKNRNDGVNYRAYNYLIQGSAADQTAESLLTLYYKYDIIPSIVVHDEINISGTLEQARTVQEVMQTAVPLVIPSVAEIGTGKNWYEAK